MAAEAEAVAEVGAKVVVVEVVVEAEAVAVGVVSSETRIVMRIEVKIGVVLRPVVVVTTTMKIFHFKGVTS